MEKGKVQVVKVSINKNPHRSKDPPPCWNFLNQGNWTTITCLNSLASSHITSGTNAIDDVVLPILKRVQNDLANLEKKNADDLEGLNRSVC